MGGEPVSVVGTVASGATYDLSVVLVAPLEPGIYQAMWEMRNAEDVSFGERLALAVQVPERPTATPAPTQTPVPDAMFTAEPTTVKPGEQVLFQWSAPGAKGVYFYAEGRDWAQFPVENTGRRAVWPDASIMYYLRVITDGGIEQRSIRIEVVPVANAPTITYFSVLPEGTMALGQCAAIQWNVQGDVTKVAVYANSTAIWDGAPLSGYMPHCPPGTGTIVYAVEAVGPGGTARLQHELTVAASGGNPPPPSGGPVITAFSATPDRLPAGSCTRIYWKVGGDFNRVRLLRNTQVVLDNAPPTGDTEDCSYDKGTFVYGVTASNAAGQTASRDATVVFE
jgi:hypothetical protein